VKIYNTKLQTAAAEQLLLDYSLRIHKLDAVRAEWM